MSCIAAHNNSTNPRYYRFTCPTRATDTSHRHPGSRGATITVVNPQLRWGCQPHHRTSTPEELNLTIPTPICPTPSIPTGPHPTQPRYRHFTPFASPRSRHPKRPSRVSGVADAARLKKQSLG